MNPRLMPGDTITVKYGNGEQAAIVTRVRRGGGLDVLRLYAAGTDARNARAAKLRANDDRIKGSLHPSDPRAVYLREALAEMDRRR